MKKKKVHKKGLLPGSIVFTGEKTVSTADLRCVIYDEAKVNEQNITEFPLNKVEIPSDDQIVWYDLKGVNQISVIEQLGKTFNIHPLVLEDVANTTQRSKFEEYKSGNFIVAQAFKFNPVTYHFSQEQISIFFSKNVVISFQEDEEELFTEIKNYIINDKGKIRQKKADFLAYLLVDTIVDDYIDILDLIEEKITTLEVEIMTDPRPIQKITIYKLKRELLTFRKSVLSLKEAMMKMARIENEYIEPNNTIFVRDLLDHITHILDRTEQYRDMLSELQNLYLSEIGYKANGVIQLLTIISSIFIPLTFIVGVYGMNFDNMPELHWEYGYHTVWFVMILIAVSLLIYFRRKRWL